MFKIEIFYLVRWFPLERAVAVARVVVHTAPFVVARSLMDLGPVELERHARMDNADPVGSIDSLLVDVDTLGSRTEVRVHIALDIADSIRQSSESTYVYHLLFTCRPTV